MCAISAELQEHGNGDAPADGQAPALHASPAARGYVSRDAACQSALKRGRSNSGSEDAEDMRAYKTPAYTTAQGRPGPFMHLPSAGTGVGMPFPNKSLTLAGGKHHSLPLVLQAGVNDPCFIYLCCGGYFIVFQGPALDAQQLLHKL